MAVKTMQDLFVHTLGDIYYAENQILKALPKMAEKAQSEELREALNSILKRRASRYSGWKRSSACARPQ